MRSSSVFFNTLVVAALGALWPQAAALAQAGGDATATPSVKNASAEGRTNQQDVEFFFAGGTPSEFVSAVEKQYHVDWAKVADIPDNMANVRIPSLRMNRQSAEHILEGRRFGFGGGGGGGGGLRGGGGAGFRGGGETNRNPLDAIIALYNSLGEAKPELGQLTVEGDLRKPSVVIFRSSLPPRTPIVNADYKMKAFALNGIPEKEWEQLEKIVDSELNTLARLQFERSRNAGEQLTEKEMRQMDMEEARASDARVALYKDTGLLIVRGPESILQAAESLVTAWRAKQPQPVKF